jgi:hypothetical protein
VFIAFIEDALLIIVKNENKPNVFKLMKKQTKCGITME